MFTTWLGALMTLLIISITAFYGTIKFITMYEILDTTFQQRREEPNLGTLNYTFGEMSFNM